MMILVAIVNFYLAKIIAKVHPLSCEYSAPLTKHVGLPPPRTIVWQPHCKAPLVVAPPVLCVCHALMSHL